jgi:hypothetical protein
MSRISLVLVLAWALTGADGARPADPPTVEQLIERLGSKSFAEREKATQLLRERGPEVLPAVRKALASKDEEVRKRAEGLIPGLEIKEALLPKRVTVKANDQSVADVLADLEKQTGYKMGGKDDARKVTIDLKEAPYWEAMDKVLQETGRDVTYQTYDKTLQIGWGTGRSPFVNVRGPFRLEARWFHEDRDLNLAGILDGKDVPRDHRLTLSVSVVAEPRLTFLKISPAKVEEALDSEGKSLLEPPGASKLDNRPPGRGTFRSESTYYSDIRLRKAGESAKTIKLVRGTIPVKAILIRKPVVVTSKVLESTGTSFRAGDESLQITRVTNQGGGSIEVQIQVPREHDQNWQWYERFRLEDDAGNRFQDHGRGSQSDGRQHWISIYYGPPNGKAAGPPTKLIFEDWVVHEHAIPFEFRDMPLP